MSGILNKRGRAEVISSELPLEDWLQLLTHRIQQSRKKREALRATREQEFTEPCMLCSERAPRRGFPEAEICLDCGGDPYPPPRDLIAKSRLSTC